MSIPLNIKHLRKLKNISQTDLASVLGVGRTSIVGYEREDYEAPLSVCSKIAAYFGVTLDALVNDDLTIWSQIPTTDLQNVQHSDNGIHNYLMPSPANAGAAVISQLSDSPVQVYVPGLPRGTYRTFPVQGDSMEPYYWGGDYVVCSLVSDFREIKSWLHYVIIAREGVWLKGVSFTLNKATLISSNPFYEPFQIDNDEILEIWKPVRRITERVGIDYSKNEMSHIFTTPK